MEEIKVKDIIFSFRHAYLENQRKLNKKLKKHIKITTPLIKDVTLYFKDTVNPKLGVRYKFKNNSVGDLIYRFCEKMNINSKLRDYAEIRQISSGEYESNSNYVHLKDQRLSKSIDCIKKEEFYKNIVSSFNDKNTRITFSNYEITVACNEFILCYNSVGDLIYTFTSTGTDIKSMLDKKIDIDNFSKFHKDIIKKEKKLCGIDDSNKKKDDSGDYLISENEDRVLLKRLTKGNISRYI